MKLSKRAFPVLLPGFLRTRRLRLETDSEEGLQQKEAAQRRQYYGANRIKSKKRRSAFRILLDQFKNLIIFLLMAAASVSYAFGQLLEGTARF